MDISQVIILKGVSTNTSRAIKLWDDETALDVLRPCFFRIRSKMLNRGNEIVLKIWIASVRKTKREHKGIKVNKQHLSPSIDCADRIAFVSQCPASYNRPIVSGAASADSS
jgi:hypothetical protein